MKSLLVLLLFLYPVSAVALGSKTPINQITFHLQTGGQEGPRQSFPVPVYGKKLFFKRLPEIITTDITAFQPFQAEDGSYGATFHLSNIAAKRISAITTQHQKSWLVAMLNGRPVDIVYIDQPVQDGKLVVWRGIKPTEVQSFDLKIPRFGDSKESWKARRKAVKKIIKKAKK